MIFYYYFDYLLYLIIIIIGFRLISFDVIELLIDSRLTREK